MRILNKSIWPYQITLKSVVSENRDPRLDWLSEKIPKERWYLVGPNRYCFKKEQDAIMFSLRWGS